MQTLILLGSHEFNWFLRTIKVIFVFFLVDRDRQVSQLLQLTHDEQFTHRDDPWSSFCCSFCWLQERKFLEFQVPRSVKLSLLVYSYLNVRLFQKRTYMSYDTLTSPPTVEALNLPSLFHRDPVTMDSTPSSHPSSSDFRPSPFEMHHLPSSGSNSSTSYFILSLLFYSNLSVH